MNKLLLAAILYLFSLSLFSQSNYASHREMDNPTKIFVDGNLTFYTATESIALFAPATLYCFNNTLKFSYTFNLQEYVEVTDIKKLSNGTIGVSGMFLPQCDVFGVKSFYAELDTNGNLLNQAVNDIYTFYGSNRVNFFELSTGEKLVLANNTVGLVNGSGYSIQLEDSLGLPNCSYTDSAHHVGYVNHSLVTGTTTVNYMNTYDLNNGTRISKIPFPFALNKIMKAPDKFYYGLTDSSYVIKFDTLFNVVSNSKLNQGTHKINDFDLKGDTIYASTENTLSVLKFDENLNQVYLYSNSQSLITFRKIKVDNNGLVLLANEEANTPTRYPNVLMAYTTLNGQLTLKNDAYVEDAYVLSGNLDPFTPGPMPQYVNVHYSLRVKVRNNGTDTLKSVYINQRPQYYQSYVCGYYLNHFQAGNIAIPPGQYAYINTSIFNDVFVVYPNQQTVNDSVSLSQTCVWTSGPNHDGDNNHMNDAYCNAVIKLPFPTGTREFMELNSEVRIYPNPASQDLHIQLVDQREDVSGMEVIIVNTLGQLVLEEQLEQDKNTIDVEGLENGIYFIEVSKNKRVLYNSKFVKN